MNARTKVTLLATTAIAATVALAATIMPASAGSFDDWRKSVTVDVWQHCQDQWGDDYQNQRSCRNTQTAALDKWVVAAEASKSHGTPSRESIIDCSIWIKTFDFVKANDCVESATTPRSPQGTVEQHPITLPMRPVIVEPRARAEAPVPPTRRAAPPAPVAPEAEPYANQAEMPSAPPTLPPVALAPLSSRLAEINQLMRQSLPIAVRHCGSDAACRKEQTSAIHELAAKETAIAKALRNPTTYTTAVMDNDVVNSCIVMWSKSEDFAETMKCINDATPAS